MLDLGAILHAFIGSSDSTNPTTMNGLVIVTTLATLGLPLALWLRARRIQNEKRQRQKRLYTHSSSVNDTNSISNNHTTKKDAEKKLVFIPTPLKPLAFTTDPGIWKLFEEERKNEKKSTLPISIRQVSAAPSAEEHTHHHHHQNEYHLQLGLDSKLLQRKIDSLFNLIMRDFLHSWYKDISPEPVFPIKVKDTTTIALNNLIQRLRHIDFPALIISRIVPFLTTHINECRNAQRQLAKTDPELLNTKHASNSKDYALASFYWNGQLHHAVTWPDIQQSQSQEDPGDKLEEEYFRKIVDDILPLLTPSSESSSECFRLLVREALVCTVLVPTLQSLSDPDYWNQTLNSFADYIIHERALIKKIHQSLQGTSFTEDLLHHPTPQHQQPTTITTTIDTSPATATTTSRSFDEFLKSIKSCENVFELLQLRDTLIGQISSKNQEIAGYKGRDVVNGVKVSDLKRQIGRLQRAKRRTDKRLTVLSGSFHHLTSAIPSLSNLLENPLYLPHFTDYMSGAKRSHLLGFWLTIDEFRQRYRMIDRYSEPVISNLDDLTEFYELISGVWETYFSPASHVDMSLTNLISPTHGNLLITLGETSSIAKSNLNMLQTTTESEASSLSNNHIDLSSLMTLPEVSVLLQLQELVFRFMLDTDYPSFIKSMQFAQCKVAMMYGGGSGNGSRVPSPIKEDKKTGKQKEYLEVPAVSKKPSPSTNSSGSSSLSTSPSNSSPLAIGLQSAQTMEYSPIGNLFHGHHQKDSSTDSKPQSSTSTLPRRKPGPLSMMNQMLKKRHTNNPTPRSTKRTISYYLQDAQSTESSQQGFATLTTHLPIRTDMNKTEHVEEELMEILASEENAYAVGGGGGGSGGGESGQIEIPVDEDGESINENGGDISENSSLFFSEEALEDLFGVDEEDEDIDLELAHDEDDDDDEEDGVLVPNRGIRSRGHSRTPSNMSDTMKEGQFDKNHVTIVGEQLLMIKEEIERLKREESVARGKKVDFIRQEIMSLETKRRTILERDLNDAVVAGVTRITITDALAHQAQGEGKDFTIYMIEISNMVKNRSNPSSVSSTPSTSPIPTSIPDSAGTTGWVVARRYSEFFSLNQALKKKFPGIMNAPGMVELPGKKLGGLMKLKKDFIAKRRTSLEKYLQALVQIPEICQYEEFRLFLCQPRSYYSGNATSMRPWSGGSANGDRNGLPAFLNLTGANNLPPSLAANLAASNAQGTTSSATTGPGGKRGLAQILKDNSEGATPSATGPSSSSSAGMNNNTTYNMQTSISGVDVVVDILMELFEWKEKSGYWTWLRRQAMLTVLTQVLDGATERKIDDFIQWLLSDEQIDWYLSLMQDRFWPNKGVFMAAYEARSQETQWATKKEATAKLMTLLPELFGNVIGKSSARRGGATFVNAFQSRLLNKHLVLILVDEIVKVVFPELKERMR